MAFDLEKLGNSFIDFFSNFLESDWYSKIMDNIILISSIALGVILFLIIISIISKRKKKKKVKEVYSPLDSIKEKELEPLPILPVLKTENGAIKELPVNPEKKKILDLIGEGDMNMIRKEFKKAGEIYNEIKMLYSSMKKDDELEKKIMRFYNDLVEMKNSEKKF